MRKQISAAHKQRFKALLAEFREAAAGSFDEDERLLMDRVTKNVWAPEIFAKIGDDVTVRQLLSRPEALVRWHRAGFRRYWRWKSRSSGGRPRIDAELRALVRKMSIDNPLWGAPRIHGAIRGLMRHGVASLATGSYH